MSSRSLISFSSTTALAISVRYTEQRYDDVLELNYNHEFSEKPLKRDDVPSVCRLGYLVTRSSDLSSVFGG